MFKFIRITILLFVLLGVGIGYLNEEKQRDWQTPLWVTIYPVYGDRNTKTVNYIQTLKRTDFSDIEKFIAVESAYWGVSLKDPLVVNLGPEINTLPPVSTQNSPIDNILYSLQLRFWAWRHAQTDQPEDIKIIVVYFNRENGFSLSHSLGFERGKLGLVNAFASRNFRGSNQFVIAHELLHTLGATDKYNPVNSQPYFPGGYANPEQDPLYPQSFAEIMGGRIPKSANHSTIPENLRNVVVRKQTATEIGWIENGGIRLP